MSVGCTRLLLASGSAPDRCVILIVAYASLRELVGSSAPPYMRPRTYMCPRVCPSPSFSPDPPYASCITASTCDSLPHPCRARNGAEAVARSAPQYGIGGYPLLDRCCI